MSTLALLLASVVVVGAVVVVAVVVAAVVAVVVAAEVLRLRGVMGMQVDQGFLVMHRGVLLPFEASFPA